MFGDAGYTDAAKHAKPKRGRRWYIATKRNTVKAITDATPRQLATAIEHAKASIRATMDIPSEWSNASLLM